MLYPACVCFNCLLYFVLFLVPPGGSFKVWPRRRNCKQIHHIVARLHASFGMFQLYLFLVEQSTVSRCVLSISKNKCHRIQIILTNSFLFYLDIDIAKLSPTPASAELDGVSLNFILHTRPPTARPPTRTSKIWPSSDPAPALLE